MAASTTASALSSSSSSSALSSAGSSCCAFYNSREGQKHVDITNWQVAGNHTLVPAGVPYISLHGIAYERRVVVSTEKFSPLLHKMQRMPTFPSPASIARLPLTLVTETARTGIVTLGKKTFQLLNTDAVLNYMLEHGKVKAQFQSIDAAANFFPLGEPCALPGPEDAKTLLPLAFQVPYVVLVPADALKEQKKRKPRVAKRKAAADPEAPPSPPKCAKTNDDRDEPEEKTDDADVVLANPESPTPPLSSPEPPIEPQAAASRDAPKTAMQAKS